MLQGQIQRYLAQDRAKLLERRCESYLTRGETIAQRAMAHLNSHYPKTLDDIERQQALDAEQKFADWFDERWKVCLEAFDNFWNEEMRPIDDADAASGDHADIQALHEAYVKVVDEVVDKHALSTDQLKQTFAGTRKEYALPGQAHSRAREELIDQKILPAMRGLTVDIAELVSTLFPRIDDWIVAHFDGLEALRTVITPDHHSKGDRIQQSVNALLLRYARPAADIFIRTKRGTPDRRNMQSHQRDEIKLLELYYRGTQDHGNLEEYLHTGSWLSSAELEQLLAEVAKAAVPAGTVGRVVRTSMIDKVPAADAVVDKVVDKAFEHLRRAPVAETFGEVEAEMTQDFEAFVEYLKHAVYHAASFKAFANQELEEKRAYIKGDEAKRRVRAVCMRARRDKHPALAALSNGRAYDAERTRRVLDVRGRIERAHALLR